MYMYMYIYKYMMGLSDALPFLFPPVSLNSHLIYSDQVPAPVAIHYFLTALKDSL